MKAGARKHNLCVLRTRQSPTNLARISVRVVASFTAVTTSISGHTYLTHLFIDPRRSEACDTSSYAPDTSTPRYRRAHNKGMAAENSGEEDTDQCCGACGPLQRPAPHAHEDLFDQAINGGHVTEKKGPKKRAKKYTNFLLFSCFSFIAERARMNCKKEREHWRRKASTPFLYTSCASNEIRGEG